MGTAVLCLMDNDQSLPLSSNVVVGGRYKPDLWHFYGGLEHLFGLPNQIETARDADEVFP
jgi:hypothetical protein